MSGEAASTMQAAFTTLLSNVATELGQEGFDRWKFTWESITNAPAPSDARNMIEVLTHLQKINQLGPKNIEILESFIKDGNTHSGLARKHLEEYKKSALVQNKVAELDEDLEDLLEKGPTGNKIRKVLLSMEATTKKAVLDYSREQLREKLKEVPDGGVNRFMDKLWVRPQIVECTNLLRLLSFISFPKIQVANTTLFHIPKVCFLITRGKLSLTRALHHRRGST